MRFRRFSEQRQRVLAGRRMDLITSIHEPLLLALGDASVILRNPGEGQWSLIGARKGASRLCARRLGRLDARVLLGTL
jgi:hypothetical protein